jgi:hypothetical protein
MSGGLTKVSTRVQLLAVLTYSIFKSPSKRGLSNWFDHQVVPWIQAHSLIHVGPGMPTTEP